MKLFDSHFHIINPDFPLVINNGYLPPAFAVNDYKQAIKDYQIGGGVVVSGSFQAFDQEYLLNALELLGKNFFGVANIPVAMADDELDRLNKAGVVAVRFNLKRGGSESVNHIEKLSNYLFERYNWHTELYVDSDDLESLKPVLKNIPKFSIDHLGLSKSGFNDLLYWVERGIKVKATGFGRIDFDPIERMKSIYRINPDALMFGTDLPSTRAKQPFTYRDIQLIENNFTQDETVRILYKNAFDWYSRQSN